MTAIVILKAGQMIDEETLLKKVREAGTGHVPADEELGGGFHLHVAQQRSVRRLPVPSWSAQLVELWYDSEIQAD